MSSRLGGAVMAIVAVLAMWATPAAAHGGATETDVPASDYRTEITSIAPALPEGLVVEVIDASTRLELRNASTTDATVFGYEGEPYLRVGADGVYENRRSPATYLNQSVRPDAEVPDVADAGAAPEWRQISTTGVARWHDHRAHWMGAGRESNEVGVVVPEWSVPISYGGESIVVKGQITHVQGPSPVGAVAGAIIVAVAVTASALGMRRRTMAVVACGGLAVSVAVDLVGRWTSTDDPVVLDGPLLFIPAGIAFAIVLGVALDARSVAQGAWMLGCAGLLAALVLGVAHFDWLNHSQLPTGIPPVLARLATVGILGFGLGLAGHALARELCPPVAPDAMSSEDRSGRAHE